MSKFAVQIQNYQILDNEKLEFENGLNVIVGDSNNGKSSIIRAIEAAIYNKSGNSFIKSGKDATAVAISSDNHVIIWKKSSDAGIYKIDGQVYNKIGRGQLNEVAETLNIKEIDVNGDKCRINFLKQMEYPFLLDKNPTQLFEFLSMSNEGDRLSEIFKNMRSDLKSVNIEIDVGVGKIDSLNEIINKEKESLEKYKNIDSITDNIISLDGRINQLNKLSKLISDISSNKDSLLNRRQRILELRKVESELKPLIEALTERINRFNNSRVLIADLRNKERTLLSLKSSIVSNQEKRDRLNNILQSVDLETIKSREDNLVKLRNDVKSVQNLKTNLESKKQKILSFREERDHVLEELSQIKTCPLCGSPLSN